MRSPVRSSELRALCREEGERAADVHGGEPDARRHEPVHHPLAELCRQPPGNAVADKLLQERVADSDRTGHREVAQHRLHQSEEPKRPGPAAIEVCHATDQAHAFPQDEDHVKDGARADRRDHRDPPRGCRDKSLGALVERRDQVALGKDEEIASVDDLAEIARRRAGALVAVSGLSP